VFHVSRLQPANLNGDLHPKQRNDERRPSGIVIDGTREYEVEEILEKRKKGRTVEFKVKWLGYPMSESTWEPRGSLMKHAKDTVLAFEKQEKRRTVGDYSPQEGGLCHSEDERTGHPELLDERLRFAWDENSRKDVEDGQAVFE
jgi:hypothetical protein